MSHKPNILVVAGEVMYPLRASIRDLIYSFKYNDSCNTFFFFTEQGPFPEYLKQVKLDLVVFTDTWAGERWKGAELLHKFVYKPLEYLKNIDVTKVVHPQDEWIYTDLLNEMITEFNISHVFSCAPESEWKKIYNKLDHNKIKFHKVLTGYLEDKTVQKINAMTRAVIKPVADIGYRAFKSPPWLGSHGFLKTRIAEVFKEQAPRHGFTVNISTEEKDTISGNNWFTFMAGCRYFIGVEGGSTVIDRDGQIFRNGVKYQQAHPNATFEEFEKACFPGMDGNLNLVAISPRHLEACAARTCQVLIEGDYNGILIPHQHYIELKKDFSNLEEVFTKMTDEKLRLKIIDQAYTDIVASGKYSYRKYTDFIINTCIDKNNTGQKSLLNPIHILHNRMSEKRFWKMKKTRRTLS